MSHFNRLITGLKYILGPKLGKGFHRSWNGGCNYETAEIGNNCLLYQGVTLGGTGKSHGKRHQH